MLAWIDGLIARARATRWVHLAVVNLRILIGFAFLPAGLKKVLGQPFTDPANSGRFHDFLDAFHATGGFYRFVGVMQLIAAVLLCTQRFATLGAALALPIVTAIGAFCWSTAVYPTASVVTLIWLGLIGLLVWDLERWRGLIAGPGFAPRAVPPAAPVAHALWTACGGAIVVLYLGVCAAAGGIYRPRGVDWSAPGFYVLPVIAVLPLVTLVLDRARHRAARSGRADARPR